MAEHLLKFVNLAKAMPDKREAESRRADFQEIYERFRPAEAKAQSSRCSQCGVPFCQVHCPLQNNIPDWLKLTAEGRLEEAYEIASATNTFPEICGRICPQDRLCEGTCAIERYITDTAFEMGWVKPIKPARELKTSIGIIGAGPAGLAAADALRRRGHQVTVYDRYDRVGGLMIYGIPGFKLEKPIVLRRAEQLIEAGIQFKLNFELGRHGSLADLRQRHDAVLIATGVYKAREMGGPGSGLDNIVPALSYLTASNRVGLGDSVEAFDSGALNAAGKRVVVIGGGDTAMDCVRTAVRQGATSVHCVYRRDRDNMPGSQREVAHAEEEGVQFVWQAQPEAFLGDANNKVSGVRCQRIHLGLPDATGRQMPQVIDGSGFTIEADLVIKALGFDPEDMMAATGSKDLALTNWGTLKIDWRTLMTSEPGVFAAGDIVRGASLVVWAIRDGRDAAAAIDSYVTQSRAKLAAE
jgi:glutamate synthase (NADPH/NADH) small chain